MLKKTLKQSSLYPLLRKVKNAFDMFRWRLKGRPNPPPHQIKQKILRKYAQKSSVRVLVETGTYYGDMVHAMLPYFDKIHTIELSDELYHRAVKRFAGNNKVVLHHGDSGGMLPVVLDQINEPTLFWLDGHYSAGDTATAELASPIYQELKHIFERENPGHVILIDDSRCFNGNGGYPTLEELKKFIRDNWPNYSFSVETDIIVANPSQASFG
jgi:hypothetical protein